MIEKAGTLLRAKLRVPFIRPGRVARPQLLARITEGLACPLTLIIAPAGFGKTTAVVSALAQVSPPAVWYTLDREDNQVDRFLSYLAAAIQQVDSSAGRQAAQLLATSQPVRVEAVLTSLANDLELTGREIVLVLDDYQFIKAQAVHGCVSFLLEHCPPTFHLVIVTRSDPPLALARLRARGQMVELRTAELRFTEDEARQFLNDLMGLRLDPPSIAALAERTEGWVAGLQMAALSMRDRQDTAGFIHGFSGTNRFILDYLVEEVLASQPPDIQRFLLCTSILDRMSARLCDTLLTNENSVPPVQSQGPTPASPSTAVLDYLERANLFLVPLDDERTWYRYHHLFSDLLHTQLEKSLSEAEIAQLHLRASTWFQQNALPIEAIQHASFAADYERVERLIEQYYIDMMNRGEMALIRQWMGKLNKEMVYRRPWLCLYEAFSRSWFGKLDEAVRLLEEADLLIQSTGPVPDFSVMQGYHAYVSSRVTAMQGNLRRAIELCQFARERVPGNRPDLQIEIGITLGYEYFLSGDYDAASRALQDMIQICCTVEAVNNPVAAYALLARQEVARGRLNEANLLYQKAANVIRESGGQYLGAVGLVEAGIADLLYEWNDLEAALVRIQHALDYLPWWGKADDQALAYATLARIDLAQGNREGAAEIVEKAVQLVQSCAVFPEARSTVAAAQAGLWLVQADHAALKCWAGRYDLSAPALYESEIERIALARVLTASGRSSEAVQLLTRLEACSRQAGRAGRLLEILILKAAALQGMGNTVQANASLAESLALAREGGFVRVYLDKGQSVRLLLARWLAGSRPGPLQEYTVQILSEFDQPVEVLSRSGGLAEPLSPREMEVLHLMAVGRTNPEIAARLVITPGTVKAHAASIYRKLDSANRTEAVARARELGILT